METDKIQLKIVLVTLTAIVSIELVVGLMPWGDNISPMVVLGVLRMIELALLLSIVIKLGRGLESIGLGGKDLLPGLKKGLIWSAIFGAAVALGFVVLALVGINPLKLFASSMPRGVFDVALFLVVGGLIAPVVEEVVFRGIFYGYFRHRGIAAAILISSGIFVLFHPLTGIPVPQIIGGVVFALAYEFTGSLVTPIIIHILGNLAIFGLSFIARFWL